MKSKIKVYQLNTQKDIQNISKVISKLDGIIAYEISLEKKEIQIIYNETFLCLDKIIETVENIGYVVI
ncbi:MAG: heavy-metal-associated domain-containing protein [Clostridiales bacterium]|nr:heavy-metal-associated domain-containing protein [Clostridiales bacterium]